MYTHARGSFADSEAEMPFGRGYILFLPDQTQGDTRRERASM
jgi:hypothetical protein